MADDATSSSSQSADSLPDPTPWLSAAGRAICPQLLYSREQKIVTQFFNKWILHPCNHRISPGYFHELPAMFDASSSDAGLKSAVKAAAYAEVGRYHRDRTIVQQAQYLYGRAIAEIRAALADETKVQDDSVTAAILIIDSFETIFTGRSEPLGPHGEGLISILRLRGQHQLLSKKSLGIWRIAHHRIQERNLVQVAQPMAESYTWMGMLDTSRPDLRIAEYALQVTSLNARAKALIDNRSQARVSEVQDLIQEMETYDHTMVEWLATINSVWKARQIWPIFPPEVHSALPNTASNISFLLYHDLWAARTLNYSRVNRLVLHQMLAKLKLAWVAGRLEGEAQWAAAIQSHDVDVELIISLGHDILRTVPMLLGLVDAEGSYCAIDVRSSDVGFMFLNLVRIPTCRTVIGASWQ